MKKQIFTDSCSATLWQVASPSGITKFCPYELLQFACYPLTKVDVKNGSTATMQLHIVVNGKLIDILEQQWPYDGTAKPDISLALYAAELRSTGHGYDNKQSLVSELIEDRRIMSAEQVLELNLALTLNVLVTE